MDIFLNAGAISERLLLCAFVLFYGVGLPFDYPNKNQHCGGLDKALEGSLTKNYPASTLSVFTFSSNNQLCEGLVQSIRGKPDQA